ncbi:type II toxin-antitoxin system PemK/MazF family toxin [Mesonia ostreae]|uniref:mRNA interferase n=1 Tax=Mesonia ostreae TaxID=861110 RepID=A0ABU2KG47_9FLAO|nr:type II toxin-antitoxin system PemK/MazF family toxin [Mesonia ostreae]MDT0293649.1 type II toxin-antitoxin system PemK/MazF family toxin [Mesonia ostreae]
MKQGEIWEVYLDPIKGSEQGGRRPAIILSGNLVNANLKTVIVCPLTTKLKNYHGNLIVSPSKQNGLKAKSEVMAIHVRSIAKEHFKNKLGVFDNREMSIIIEGLSKIIKY